MLHSIQESSLKEILKTLFEQVLIPHFVRLAKDIKLKKVYFWANIQSDNFYITTLQNRKNPDIEIQIFNIFATEQDAKRYPGFNPRKMKVDSLPILFAFSQILATKGIDRLMIYPVKGQMNKSFSIVMEELREVMREEAREKGILKPTGQGIYSGLA